MATEGLPVCVLREGNQEKQEKQEKRGAEGQKTCTGKAEAAGGSPQVEGETTRGSLVPLVFLYTLGVKIRSLWL